MVIVDNPAKGIIEGNLKTHEGKGPCPHLRGTKPGEYSCSVHDETWYPETPCAQYTQIDKSPDRLCRMGAYIMKGNSQQ